MIEVKIIVPRLDNSGPANGARALAKALSSSRFFNPQIIALNKQRIQPDAGDLLVSMCFRADLACFYSSLVCRVRWICSLRSNIYSDYSYLYGKIGLLLAFINNLLIRRADFVIGMYEEMFDGLALKIRKERQVVIPNLIHNSTSEAYGSPTNVKRLVVIGSLTERKGILPLLNLLQNFTSCGLEVVFIGDGPFRKVIQSTITHCGLADKVFCLGHLPNAYSSLRDGDYVLSNSYSEGMSRALLDSVSLGYPVICRDLGGATRFIEHGINGYLFRAERELEDLIASIVPVAGPIRLPSRFRPEIVSAKWRRFLIEVARR